MFLIASKNFVVSKISTFSKFYDEFLIIDFSTFFFLELLIFLQNCQIWDTEFQTRWFWNLFSVIKFFLTPREKKMWKFLKRPNYQFFRIFFIELLNFLQNCQKWDTEFQTRWFWNSFPVMKFFLTTREKKMWNNRLWPSEKKNTTFFFSRS